MLSGFIAKLKIKRIKLDSNQALSELESEGNKIKFTLFVFRGASYLASSAGARRIVQAKNEVFVLRGYKKRSCLSCEVARKSRKRFRVTEKDSASKEAEEIVTKAKASAEAIKEKAALEIEHEKARVKKQIKEEISEVAFLAASKVVLKELDEETHKKYVDDFIEQAGE